MKDPIELFLAWFKKAQAQAKGDSLPEACCLATASRKSATPSARMVLFKGLSGEGSLRGLSFYTNYESRKSSELKTNPQASLVFYWHELQRQVRVEGRVKPVSRAESVAYFKTRPRGSQIGAWASAQSHPLRSMSELKKRVRFFEKKFKNQEIPCPPHWGGFNLIPLHMEFWVGKLNRLHERTLFTRKNSAKGPKPRWTQKFLNP